MTGSLYIVSAASGTGKTSLNHAVIEQMDNIKMSVAYTTRPARVDEIDGVDYSFVSIDEFEKRIEADEFLEYANVFGHYYGTSKQRVAADLKKGLDVILEIDWQGARTVRKKMLDTISVFILPPSRKILQERLTGRNQDDDEVIARRLKMAGEEIAHCVEYDYLVVNADFAIALEDLKAIVRAGRCRRDKLQTAWKKLIDKG